MPRINFLNTQIDNVTMDEAVDIIERLISKGERSYLVTPNMDHIVLIEEDKEFMEIYENADLILTDGKPLLWISKYLKEPIKEKVSGSDLFPNVCSMAAKKGYSLYILGAAEGVAQKAAEVLKKQFSGLMVVGTYSPPIGFEKNNALVGSIIDNIKNANPDILAVSLGSPKGEKFIYKHLSEMNVPINMSIGAAIDFIAGNVKRCPKWMSDCGLEWLHRIIKNPKRMGKRYWNDAIKIVPVIRKYRR